MVRQASHANKLLFIAAWLLPALAVAIAGWAQPAVVTRLQDQLFDTYQRLSPRTYDPASAPVRIVDIDDASLASIGQWPWSRTIIARLLERLSEAGAAAVAFDMVFSEADRTSPEMLLAGLSNETQRRALTAAIGDMPGNDAVLAKAVARSNVVLGMVLTQTADAVGTPSLRKAGWAFTGRDPSCFAPSFRNAVLPLVALRQESAGLGALNWLPDGDQIVRRVPMIMHLAGHADGQMLPGLVLESLRVAQGASTFLARSAPGGIESIRVGELLVDTEMSGDVRPRFTPHRTERFVSAAAVLKGTVDPALLRDRIVIVGASSAGLTDIRATPIDPAMPGVEIQAQTLETILAHRQLVRPPWLGFELLAGALLTLVLALALPRLPVLAGGALAVVALGLLAAASWIAFVHQRLVDPLVPGAMVSAAYLGATAVLFRTEQLGRRFVENAFGRFVSPAVVSRLAADPTSLVLGGEQRQLTVMFSDVRSFSAIAERMEPRELTRFMNSYLSPMTALVLERHGTVDKYIGDAIMAFWNAPLSDPDHAGNAARAALAMVAALSTLNNEWRLSSPLRCGIGIATGPCVVGNFGSALRFDYSAIGDDVNLASRLEGLTKLYGIDIIASEATAAACPDLAWLEVDTVIVAGRSTATRLFTPVGDDGIARDVEFLALSRDHSAMFDKYRAARFSEAAEACAALKGRGFRSIEALYDTLGDRCRRLCQEPPPEWDGITRITHK